MHISFSKNHEVTEGKTILLDFRHIIKVRNVYFIVNIAECINQRQLLNISNMDTHVNIKLDAW